MNNIILQTRTIAGKLFIYPLIYRNQEWNALDFGVYIPETFPLCFLVLVNLVGIVDVRTDVEVRK